jgi:hypothetical protein
LLTQCTGKKADKEAAKEKPGKKDKKKSKKVVVEESTVVPKPGK